MPRGIYKRSKEHMIKVSKKRKEWLENNPQERKRMAERSKQTMTKLWSNEEFRNKMSKQSKITFKNNKWNVGKKRSNETRLKMSIAKRTGGEWVDEGGHVRVRIYDESGGNRIRYKHRIIMEQFLGRKLKTDEYIHHRNGIKTDNRIENLEIVLPQSHHGIIECPYCQKLFSIK